MERGDLIWFRQACRGGYGYQRDVPGMFIQAHPTRVTVRLFHRYGEPVDVVVHPRNVRPRHETDTTPRVGVVMDSADGR